MEDRDTEILNDNAGELVDDDNEIVEDKETKILNVIAREILYMMKMIILLKTGILKF